MPLRFVGAVTRANLPNEVGSNDCRATAGATQPNVLDNAVLIDAVNETGLVGFPIPSQWGQVGHLRFQFRSVVTALINVRLTILVCRCGVAFPAPASLDIQLNANAISDIIICVNYDPSLFGVPVRPGDFIFACARFRAAGGGGLDTNIYFLGALATEV